MTDNKRKEVEDKVATAACAVSSRLEEAEPAIKACMALWDCVADAMHRDALCAPDSTENPKPMAFAEDSIPGIAHYLGREYQSWEEILKVRSNWYLVRLSQMIRKKPLPIQPPCDGNTGAEMEEAQTMNEMEHNYSSAVAAANETKGKLKGPYQFDAAAVLESWKRADKLIEALKAQSNRWKNRYESKHMTISDVTSILNQLEKLQKHSLALQTQLDVERKTSDAIANALKLERDDAGKVFGRLGLVAKEIAGISDNAPSMECIDAIRTKHQNVKDWAGRLMGVLRNRDVYPRHVINDICDKAASSGIRFVNSDPL